MLRLLTVLLVLVLHLVPAGLSARSQPAASPPLEQVLERVREGRARGEKPIVVFDLDDTLFRVAFRTRKILRDWSNQHPASLGLRARIEAMDPLKMPWSLNATLDQLGITDPELRKSANQYWGKSFFGNDYLTVDETIRGSVVYVRKLAHSGAQIVYLTGRDSERMRPGTELALRKAGFPPAVPGGAILMMKPVYTMKDFAYKEQACNDILKMGKVVASIDNEPRNCNIFKRLFPGALIVCVDTPHSDDAPPMDPGIPTVPDYRY